MFLSLLKGSYKMIVQRVLLVHRIERVKKRNDETMDTTPELYPEGIKCE